MGLKENLQSECVSKLPCREAILIQPETSVRQAAEIMQAKKLGCAVVVDAEGKPIGIFTERTLIELLLQQPDNLAEIPVRDHLETEWFCVHSSDPISAVLDAVQKRGARFVCELDAAGKGDWADRPKGLVGIHCRSFPGTGHGPADRRTAGHGNSRRSLTMAKLEHHLGDFVDPLSNYEPREYSDALQEALAEETVAAIRSRPYAEISPDKSIYSALQALAGLKVASLLVVENGRLVGVFTERDVLERVALRFHEVKRIAGPRGDDGQSRGGARNRPGRRGAERDRRRRLPARSRPGRLRRGRRRDQPPPRVRVPAAANGLKAEQATGSGVVFGQRSTTWQGLLRKRLPTP